MNEYEELLTFLLNKNPEFIYKKNYFLNHANTIGRKKPKIILEKFMKSNPQPLTNRNKSKNEIKNNINDNNKYFDSKDPFSKIKIHKTNQNQIKALMIPN